MRPPDLQTLRLFLSVYELGNLTRAAERHNIATSAVTKRIQDLELDYNVVLFERQSRGVTPTAAADELARHARESSCPGSTGSPATREMRICHRERASLTAPARLFVAHLQT